MNKVLISMIQCPPLGACAWSFCDSVPVRRTTLAGGRGNSVEIAPGKGVVFLFYCLATWYL